MLEYIILGFLMQRKATGYDLKQYMAESTSYFFDASYGSIYPALKRLEEKRFIRSEEQVTGGKFKKLYSITGDGQKYFLDWLKQPVRFSKTRLDHLVPFFFYDYLDPETAGRNLTQFIEEASLGLEELRAQQRGLDANRPECRHSYHYSVLVYGIRYYEMLIRWCMELAGQTPES
ncbi:PadR family transcriptional regulator [Hungatella hathewayi]|uniref:PadR family transcriptional regulator n=1 Tax=Hungatella hathewayi TaxID=154046 RepID=UPI0035642FCF